MSQSRIEVINYVPKFLNFYEKAKGKENENIWDLWKEHYNFAAVPPGEQGQKMAKEMLMGAWDKYPENIPSIEKWRPNKEKVELHKEKVEFYLNEVKQLLGFELEIDMVLIYFVGAFENNPFIAPSRDGRTVLGWPIESNLGDILLAHELTHIVHSKTAEFSANWERTVGAIVLQEGLAMHVSRHLFPGRPDEAYTESKKGWLEACRKNSKTILKGILPYLEDSSNEKVYQFTMGQGNTCNEREAYFVGWESVDALLKEGMSFAEIAKIKETDMPETIGRTIHKLIK